ncbi:tyrosine-type recombinase/integrase [Shewanella seohaensis]|uniref:tyrosine-type recombinase/integrase n=1 Tax=Shewanella seohaensis TaxID=755175 RepID=UPI0035B975CD
MATYLHKNRNGNYYSRIPFPACLKAVGFPSEVRFSLRTKDRNEAMVSNLEVALKAKLWIEEIKVAEMSEGLKNKVIQKRAEIRLQERTQAEIDKKNKQYIEQLKASIQLKNQLQASEERNQELVNQNQAIKDKAKQIHSVAKIKIESTELANKKITEFLTKNISIATPKPAKPIKTLNEVRSEFLVDILRNKLIARTVQQLETRTAAFIEFAGGSTNIADITYADARAFQEHISQGRKGKTVKDYLGSCRQMFGYAFKLDYVEKNHFSGLKVPDSETGKRDRWISEELTKLFSCKIFTEHKYRNVDDYWLPLVMLHTGARPSEICQLETADYEVIHSIPSLKITDDSVYEDNQKRVKNKNAKRTVPIHRKLIELGFLKFIEVKLKRGDRQLFSSKPTGKYQEWSKSFAQRFGRTLDKLGFEAGNRPTAYGFRHTVRDEFKINESSKDIVTELIGHEKETFGEIHYTHSEFDIVRKLEVLHQGVNFDKELIKVASDPLF